MKQRGDRPKFLPPMWLVILVMCAGVYGTSMIYHALFLAGSWGSGLIGLATMLLCVLILGTPLAMARIMRKKIKQRKALS